MKARHVDTCNCITIASTSICTYLKARWAAVEIGVTGSGSSTPLSERGKCTSALSARETYPWYTKWLDAVVYVQRICAEQLDCAV
eukprot:1636-Heterococcus_DN1.PRE.1